MKFYVTTAIPYVNDKPHLGHAMLFTYADVLARYHRQQGDKVLLSIGTDEHGGKILEKAQEQNLDPQEFVDSVSINFKDLAKALSIQADNFIRTTDPDHIKAAQELWQKFAGDIYKSIYKGYYCTGHENFVSTQEVKANKGICPEHNRPYEELEEENYFFRLSKYIQPIKEAITKGDLTVVPESRKNEVLSALRAEDVSFSRPKEKIPWGVEVPGDPTHVMYVWVDALINYLSSAGYPNETYKNWWPADVQVIGKDLLRFHALIWPAMLLAAGIELPKTIYAHGFITVEGKKMGKSLGNAVDPMEIVAKYGADPFRYYVLHEVPSDADGDFRIDRLEEAYNSDLADDLGNLIQRTVTMISQYQKGIVGKIPSHSHDVTPYNEALGSFRFDKALDEVWLLIKGLNQYVEEEKPWQIAKKQDNEHLSEVLAYLVSNILQVSSLLEPFLPTTAAKIDQTFADGVVHPEVGLLFPKQSRSKL